MRRLENLLHREVGSLLHETYHMVEERVVDLLLSFLSLNRCLLSESEDKLKVLNDCN